MIDLIALIIISILITILAAFVFTRNTSSTTNRYYALFCLLAVNWSIFSYLANKNYKYSTELLFNKFSFTSGILLIFAVWLFSANFPIKSLRYKLQLTTSRILVIFIGFLTLITSLIVKSIKYDNARSVVEVETGTLYFLYLIGIIIFCVFIFDNFRKAYITKKNDSLIRQQVIYVALGVLLSSIWVFITTALIPSITNNWSISRLGFIGIIFFESLTAFAIVRHKLFDIRLIVARSLGYILTLATLVGAYVILIFGVSATFLGTGKLSGIEQALYIVATLVFGFSLPPLKRFFDRLTNKLFYQDAYDVQAFLDQFNKTLVGNIDIQPLLRQSSELIETTLKAESCVFEIHATENSPRRLIGSHSVDLSEDEVSIIMTESENIHLNMIIADELTENHADLKAVLSKNNIAVLSQLNSAVKKTKSLGYLVLGQKKSGNPYNKQDLQVLEIISNELVIAVQNALRFEEIQEFTVTLQEKVEDRTKELRKANEKLKALDETKDEFISMASHQLRTPLTAVKGYVSMVVEGDAGKLNKPQKELLDQAFASSQRMVYLIADLLNVSRLKTGKFVIENKETQLADVVESEIKQLTEMAASKNQTLTFNKPAKFPAMMLDETKMRQVIMNFSDNALHYTPNDGHIQLNLVDKPESIEFTVVDDGLGVPKAEQHHLFGKFFRAGNAKKARPDGTGLGLFMAKKVIIAQGGAVIFNSEENKGSTFGFTIPKTPKNLVTKQNASVKSKV